MAISHIKTLTVADGADTTVVRPSDWNSVHNEYYTAVGNINAAYNSTASGTNILFAASGMFSIGATSNSLIFFGPALGSQDRFNWPVNNFTSISAPVNGSASVFPISVPCPIVFSRMGFFGSISAGTAANNSSAFIDHSYSFYIYTRTDSTINALVTATSAFTTTYSSNATGSVNGVREMSLTCAQTTLSAGLYYIGINISTASTATGGAATTGITHNITLYGGDRIGSINNFAAFGETTNASRNFLRNAFFGVGTTNSNTLLTSYALAAFSITGTALQRANLAIHLKNVS
jgi:hypothetical protein